MSTSEPGHNDPALKLYVLVRRDLPWAVRCVQAIHASLCLYEHNSSSASMPVVLIGVADEAELSHWLEQLSSIAQAFYEPDLDDQLTAIAFISSSLPELESLRLL